MVPGLLSAVPVVERLPAIYQEQEFVHRFTAAFDETLAPALATLDGLAAYVDPALTPEDFLIWLGDWVGVTPDDAWSLPQWRAVVAGAAAMHRRRGTAAGLAEAVRLAVGGSVEIDDSGGSAWSLVPGGSLPGTALQRLHVRVTVRDPGAVDVRQLDAVVADVKPAHIPHTVEVVGESAPRAEQPVAPPPAASPGTGTAS